MGEFKRYRATTRIHIGQIGKDVYKDDILEFDGTTLRYGGEEYAAPTIRAAIRVGWLVDAEDTKAEYVPQPAGVEVHPPQNYEGEAEAMSTETVTTSDEDVVGSLGDYQDRRTEASDPQRRRAAAIPGDENEGVPVARVQSEPQQTIQVTDAGDVERALKQLAESPPPRVEVGRGGSDVEDLLPDAASSGTPKARTATLGVSDSGVFRWDLDADPAQRIRVAVEEYGAEPDVLRKILDSETTEVRKQIVQELKRRLRSR